jgi:signal recognition particle receptor subunit beta
MPYVDHGTKELLLKVVYYGPGLSGKTTNLEYLHRHSHPEYRGKLLSLNSESERTLFFDLLPVDLGCFKGYSIRLHLCTVPGQVFQDGVRKLVLRRADGVVFVADSQEAALDSNIVSLDNLEANLLENELDPTRTPCVLQYNKCDIPGAMLPGALRQALGIPRGIPEVCASARDGRGVFETLRAIVEECLKSAGDPFALPAGRVPSILPGHRVSMYPDAVAGGSHEERVVLPRPPALPDFGPQALTG